VEPETEKEIKSRKICELPYLGHYVLVWSLINFPFLVIL